MSPKEEFEAQVSRALAEAPAEPGARKLKPSLIKPASCLKTISRRNTRRRFVLTAVSGLHGYLLRGNGPPISTV